MLGLITLIGAGGWFVNRPVAETPEHALFARALPGWSIERLNDRDGAGHRRLLLEAANPWPGLVDPLARMTDAYGLETKVFREAVKAVNAAAAAAGLTYWVDAPRTAGKQWVTTYDVLGRSRWTLDQGASTNVLRVRRLDRVNLEMAFLGHADGSEPVVLFDRVESELLDLMKDAYDTVGRAGTVESASRGAWRTAMQDVADPDALAEAWKLLEARTQRFRELLVGNGRRVELEAPERIEWGDEWLDTLEPYADLHRPDGPLIMPGPLRLLREADRALRRGPAREALEKVLAVMALSTEAHEARHALEPFGDREVPPIVLEEAGDDDLRFARSAANEATAYLGQLYASDRPCQVLSVLAQRAAGDQARATPHHYAARAILRALSADPTQPLTAASIEDFLLETCRRPTADVQRDASKAHETLFGLPFVAAHREPPAP